MEEEVRRLRCKGEEDEGRHEDGLRIDPRGDVVINRVEGVEEVVAPIDPSSDSVPPSSFSWPPVAWDASRW